MLKDIPKKKKKCPACGNYIYVRTKQNLFPSVLLREEDALAVDGFEKLKAYGIAQQDFTSEKNRLLKEKNSEVSSIDVCMKLYDKALLRTTDLHTLKMIHFERALFLYYTNRDFFIDLQMSLKMELMAYQKEGNKKVSIFAGGDSCPECKKLSGKVYTIDEALREKPIPCKAAASGCVMAGQDGAGVCICLINELLILDIPKKKA